MKKTIILIVLLSTLVLPLFSQVKPADRPVVIKKIQPVTPTPPPPAQAPPPAPASKTTPPVTPAAPLVYRLTSARVTVKTGQDNKEFPSTLSLYLIPKQYAGQPRKELFVMGGMTTEMRSNSSTDLGLDKANLVPTDDYLLTNIQNNGIVLGLHYFANTIFDAWKIEGVTIMLEFRDQNGGLHPTLGNKTITFTNAVGFLNYFDKDMVCVADGYFTPLSANIPVYGK